MIKVVHIADLHLGGNYPDKAAASIEFLMEQLENSNSAAFRPDLIVCTGDTTEKPLHVHSEALRPLLKLIGRYSNVPYCATPLVFLQGTPSHEPYGFLHNLKEAGGMMTVLDSPTVALVGVGNHSTADSDEGPKDVPSLAIAALPAINKPILAKWAANLGLPEGEPDDHIRNILLWINEQWKGFKGPKLLLGHWTVNGCTTASGQTLYGSDLAIGLDDIYAAGANATLLGHIHKVQDWRSPDAEQYVTYCGSSYPCDWGELDPKSFSVLEFDSGGEMRVITRINFPHKPMVKIDVEFTGELNGGNEWMWRPVGSFDAEQKSIITGKTDYEAKICYSVPKEIAHQIDDMLVRLTFQKLGHNVVAVERTIQATSRERIADLASRETTRSQYECICTAKSEEPRPGALDKADQIDERVRV